MPTAEENAVTVAELHEENARRILTQCAPRRWRCTAYHLISMSLRRSTPAERVLLVQVRAHLRRGDRWIARGFARDLLAVCRRQLGDARRALRLATGGCRTRPITRERLLAPKMLPLAARNVGGEMVRP